MTIPTVINLRHQLSRFSEQWSPRIIADLDGFQFKLAKLEGDFVWHLHEDADEAFLVLEGELRIDFRDGAVTVRPGEILVVPKGVEHKPFAESECHVMILEREGVVNTGDAPESDLTADPNQRLR